MRDNSFSLFIILIVGMWIISIIKFIQMNSIEGILMLFVSSGAYWIALHYSIKAWNSNGKQ